MIFKGFIILFVLGAIFWIGVFTVQDRQNNFRNLKQKLERCEDYQCPPPITNKELRQMILQERLKWFTYITKKYPGVKVDSNLISDLRSQIGS